MWNLLGATSSRTADTHLCDGAGREGGGTREEEMSLRRGCSQGARSVGEPKESRWSTLRCAAESEAL
jgi:hypothetical protein